MANNKIIIELQVNGNKEITLAARQIDKTAKSVDNLKTSNKKAANAAGELAYKMDQGIIGSSSAARSFSKLNQSIGHGPNGLVGAYATLAANIFAVSAAFNALRNAEQVDLLFKGLEAQGARTGKTLGLIADKVREISAGALSAADSMQAVALASSAGINGKNIEDLTKIARNASVALGRNMPDAMDRIFKGVVKLEPELLDELGLMTKLTEATRNYARENGKSAESLSGFEKRVAFMEAIKKEGAFKYEGIADTTGVNAFDRLAATFSNLIQQTLSWISTSSVVRGILTVLTDTTYGLTGALLLFGNTLKTALLATFYNFVQSAAASAEALKIEAAEQKLATKAKLEGAQANITAARAAIAEGKAVSGMPKAYAAMVPVFKSGSQSIEEYDRSINTLNRSLSAYTGTVNRFIMDTGKRKVSPEAATHADAQATLITQEIANLERLKAAEIEYTNNSGALAVERIAASNTEAKSNAANASLAATEYAAKFQLIEAYKSGKIAVSEYARSLALERQLSLAAAAANGTSIPIYERLMGRITILRTGVYALSTAFKVLGTAMLSAIPIVGTLMLAWSLIEPVIGWFKSDDTKKKEKAFEDLNKVLDEHVSVMNEYNRTLNANDAIGQTTAKLLTIQSNSVNEIADAFNETQKPIIDANRQLELFGNTTSKTTLVLVNYTKVLTGLGLDRVVAQSRELLEAMEHSESTGTEMGSKIEAAFHKYATSFSATTLAYNTYSEEQAQVIKSLQSVIDLVPDAEQTFFKLNKTMKDDANKAAIATINLYAKGLKNITPVVNELTEAFKNQETAYQDFIKSLKPTTPYDNIVTSITNTNNAIYEADKAFKAAKESGLDFSDKLSKLLSLMGPSSRNILDIDTQKSLDKVDELQSRINTLTDKKLQTEGVIQQAAIQSEITVLQEQSSGILKEISPEIIKQNEAYEDQLRQNQILHIQGQAQITLAQAKLATLTRTTAVTAASLKEQLDQENKIKKLQADQVALGIAELKQDILMKQNKIAELNANIESHDILKTIGQEVERQYYMYKLSRLELEKANAVKANDISLQAQINSEIIATTTNLEKVNDIDFTKKLDESTEGFKRNIASISKSIVLEQAQINNLSAQQQAILEGMLSTREIELKGMKLTIGNNEVYNNSLEESRKLKEEQVSVDDSISKLLQGRHTSAIDELEVLKRQYVIKQRSLVLDKAAKIAQLEVSRAEAKNASDKAKYSTDIDIARRELSISLDLEESKFKLANLEKVLLDTSKEGLEIQQRSLEIANKYYDLQSQLVTQRGALAQSNLDIIAAKYGVEVDAQAQKRIALRTAKEEYSLAQAQLDIKIEGIKLEYALLEAQRIQQVLNWTMQRKLIALQLESSGAMTSEIAVMLGQLDSAISVISARGYRDQEELAVRYAKGEVELKRRKAVELEAGIRVSGSPVLNEIRAAFENIAATRNMGVPEEFSATISTMKTIIPDFSKKLETGINNINNGIKDSQANLIKSNTDLIAVLNTLVAAYKGTVNTNAQTTIERVGGKLNILDAKKYALAHGARNDDMEYGSKSPKHGGSGHREFRAIDINLGGGNSESTDPKLRAQANLMAKNLAEKGFIVLWNHFKYVFDERTQQVVTSKFPKDWGPHDDHLHAEVPAGGRTFRTDPALAAKTSTAAAPAIKSAAAAPTVNKTAMDLGTRTKEIVEDFLKVPPLIGKIDAEFQRVLDNMQAKTREALLPWEAKDSKMVAFWETANAAAAPYLANLAKLGPSGELVVALYQGTMAMSSGVTKLGKDLEGGRDKWAAMADMASTAISTVSAITAAASNAKIANIDKEISAEERRDGKSAASLQKLDAMNKKKDDIARKQFNLNKKLSMAQAVIATATGIAEALKLGPIAGPLLAGMIGVLGAAQIAIIAGTSYESAYKPVAASMPTNLSIGKVGNSVDLAKGPNSNAGGEVGYLRNAEGTGSNASNFRTVGSAYGGDLMRGYGNRGFTVGEKGPETISPDVPITVTPNNQTQGQNLNATINIQALDSAGVKDILVDQKGNIIKMLRDAANAQGQRFLEDVNVNVYTRPNVSKL